MICNGEIIAPPQKCPLVEILLNDTAHPQLESTADSPPTILFSSALVFEHPQSAFRSQE